MYLFSCKTCKEQKLHECKTWQKRETKEVILPNIWILKRVGIKSLCLYLISSIHYKWNVSGLEPNAVDSSVTLRPPNFKWGIPW